MTPLSSHEILRHLGKNAKDLPIFVHNSLDSTNTEARRLLTQNIPRPFLVLARTQTAGRGRLGRSFHSPVDSGLYMTVAFDMTDPPEKITVVTPTAAVATVLAIQDVCGKQPNIKWVNDLYLHGRKICGILTEAVAYEEGYHILVGIGVNLTTKDFPEGMRNPAGALLSPDDPPVNPSLLCARIIHHLFEYLTPSNTSACLQAYRRHLLHIGQNVTCTRHFSDDGDHSTDLRGVVEGVDDDYGLILRLDDGTQEILRGGEISLSAASFHYKKEYIP